jgi:tetratricopeptide repeat protein
VAYEKIGDLLLEDNLDEEALKFHLKSYAIKQRLAKADPSDARLQRDLLTSYHRVAFILVGQDKLSDALVLYRDSAAIAERLAETDRNNAEWHRLSP